MMRTFFTKTLRSKIASRLGLVEVEKLRKVESLMEDQKKLSHTAWKLLRSSERKYRQEKLGTNSH